MMNCSTEKCNTTNTVVGVVRILAGLAMVIFGVMKFGAPAEMQAFVGGAGHKMGLTFLSTTAWYWIAMIGEILAGLMLLTGCKKFAKIGAILTLIIMVFAINAAGFGLNAILLTLAALIVLILGPGKRCFCKGSCCKGGCCGDGACDMPGSNDQQQQQQ